MKRALAGAFSGLMLTVTVTTSAQETSLAAVAKQERARRASIGEKSKVYTNDDLRGGPRLTTGTPPLTGSSIEPAGPNTTPSADAAVLDGPNGPETEPGLDGPNGPETGQGEEYWRNRIMTARDERRRADLMAAALQNRVDGLWADFTARDDPYQRAEIGQARIEALEELEQTKADVLRLDQEIRDTQEEARRAGVPPGWLR